jgi:disulfide bond formation protein DsbB
MLLAQLKGHYIPLSQFVTTMLRGSGDCAQVTWRFLGLSMAGWTLIWYVLLGAWALLTRSRGNKLGGARTLRASRS